jgi:hypothetical protein
MYNSSDIKSQNLTSTDLELAAAYYPILVELAQQRRCLSYGELLSEAQRRYPDQPVVQRAIPVSTGRRLDVIRLFCAEHNIPNLSALILNKERREAGSGIDQPVDPKDAVDPKETCEAIFAYDWSELTLEFDDYLTLRRRAPTPRKKVSAATARTLMAEHYAVHKMSLPKDVVRHREVILGLIEKGGTAAEAFEQALKA